VDHDVYRQFPVERHRDTVLFYARASTPRRAVPLGMLALEELRHRRPELRVVAFGEVGGLPATFPHQDLGVATPGQLALAYCRGTVGLCLSLTIPQEMMACGMPCVDVAGGSSEAEFGSDGPAALAEPDPVALADAMEGLLDNPVHGEGGADPRPVAPTGGQQPDRAVGEDGHTTSSRTT